MWLKLRFLGPLASSRDFKVANEQRTRGFMTTDRKLSVWVKVLSLFFVAILLFFLLVFFFWFSMVKILGVKAREVKKLIVN